MTAISATIPAPARRVSPLDGMRNTFTLTWRSVLKIRTNMEDVIGLSLQPTMFLLLFTYVFGGAIAHGSTHDYLQYELPALLVMTVVFATLGTGLMLNHYITSGVFDRLRSLPLGGRPGRPVAPAGAGPLGRVRPAGRPGLPAPHRAGRDGVRDRTGGQGEHVVARQAAAALVGGLELLRAQSGAGRVRTAGASRLP